MKFAAVVLVFLVGANAYPSKPLVQILVNVDSASDVSSPVERPIFIQPPTGSIPEFIYPEGIQTKPTPENVGNIGIMPIPGVIDPEFIPIMPIPEIVDPGFVPIVPLPEIVRPEIVPIRPLPEFISGKPMPANFAELFQQLKEQYGRPSAMKPTPAIA